MLKVLVADDHTIVRKGLIQILKDGEEKRDLDEAENGQEALDKIRKHHYDILILDITMPGMSGLDVLKIIKKEKPELPVLALSVHSEEQYAVRMIKAGAAGYLTKESAPEELIRAVDKIAGGGRYISASVAEKLASFLSKEPENEPHKNLSDREYQVMLLIASGKSVTDIANVMSLSVKTISTYRTRILEKMNMKHNSEIIHYAVKHNLV